ncbi:hypothetical protein [Clostridium estertheticum]|uniref:hypothetical protein n=1 Tax=Clostridium estertheticum TaxID=238834 RepID=UPI001C7CBCBA|nr:hypothetical protein [Clostridium estertheticum]MBX4270059.1 hypothetical protein [Clostridium estertheticum]WLC80263.1 hypothetical protein KTC98_02715 [Clostridium estertheticum]
MNYKNHIFIASCVFTREYPALSAKIQKYLKERFEMQIIRCCVPNYKTVAFENDMPDWYRETWHKIPAYKEFKPGDVMVSICHNCSAIFEESKPEIPVKSLWELLLEDSKFPFADYGHEKMTVQDCWRSRDKHKEQNAVRALLKKMNIDVVELPDEKKDFCGVSLYQPAPPRNLKLAPNRFVTNAAEKFLPHTEEESLALMQEYCKKIPTEKVVAYCHYCVKGLRIGGKDTIHLASLLFE